MRLLEAAARSSRIARPRAPARLTRKATVKNATEGRDDLQMMLFQDVCSSLRSQGQGSKKPNSGVLLRRASGSGSGPHARKAGQLRHRLRAHPISPDTCTSSSNGEACDKSREREAKRLQSLRATQKPRPRPENPPSSPKRARGSPVRQRRHRGPHPSLRHGAACGLQVLLPVLPGALPRLSPKVVPTRRTAPIASDSLHRALSGWVRGLCSAWKRARAPRPGEHMSWTGQRATR